MTTIIVHEYNGRVYVNGYEFNVNHEKGNYNPTYQDMRKCLNSVILNNQIFGKADDWELISGCETFEPELYEEGEEPNYKDIYQFYIIDNDSASILQSYFPDEIVYYSDDLDLYLWGVTHYGTPWNGVESNSLFVWGVEE